MEDIKQHPAWKGIYVQMPSFVSIKKTDNGEEVSWFKPLVDIDYLSKHAVESHNLWDVNGNKINP